MSRSLSSIPFSTIPFASLSDINLDTFSQICSQTVNMEDYPHALAAEANILLYRGSDLLDLGFADREDLKTEKDNALSLGPGVVIIRNSFSNTNVLDQQTEVFERIVKAESAHRVAGDHFAAPGANTRIWNAIQKTAERTPEVFIQYYANPIIHLISESWLGPHYQITSQVNIVHPGGLAQQPHRDYHLGFQTNSVASRYPVNVHRLSPLLTLQGAVAHTDMPLATGPTILLPYSHQYDLGYLAWRDAEFKHYFSKNAVQLPLQKGDQLYFNPALFHAAGGNHTAAQHRMANLLQVSSAFGVPMETIDRRSLVRSIYPTLSRLWRTGLLSEQELANVIATSADGYSFPTNLDTDPPVDGLAPQTDQQILEQAVHENWPELALAKALEQHAFRRRA